MIHSITLAIPSSIALTCLITFISASYTTCSGQETKPSNVPLQRIQLTDLDDHFPFSVPESLAAWKPRSEHVRKQLLVSLGLWPMPTMAPMEPIVHSQRMLDGYSISKVYFESLPGLYVTGSLFLPEGSASTSLKRPAVLCPHGHWVDGRFYWANDDEVKQLFATGAERFESAARNHMQARCVQLARMGCVVFQYDMLGYADSQQVSFDRAHRFGLAGPNPETKPGSWLLYSPTAEGHLQSTMALQTINSLQAFEFLAKRNDVDPAKIAITGASGGGTQSFIAAALEPRIAGAFPAVMVSTGMQGGCTCENACGLRVGTGNVEVAALIAPRPMGLTAADDWTRTMSKDGFPELQKVYELFDAKERVQLHASVHFPHNYNHVARVALYGFANQLFGLKMKEPILERDFEVLKRDDLTVWDNEHPMPPSGLEFESILLKRWTDDVASKLKSNPELASQGWKILLEPANSIALTLSVTKSTTSSGAIKYDVKNAAGTLVGELTIPSSKKNGANQVIRLVSQPTSEPPESKESTLLLHDAYGYSDSGQQPLVKNPRPAASYTYGYNSPQAIRKIAVLLRVLDELAEKSVELLGVNELAFYAHAAERLRPGRFRSSDESTFDFSIVDSIQHPMFVPGSLRFGPLGK